MKCNKPTKRNGSDEILFLFESGKMPENFEGLKLVVGHLRGQKGVQKEEVSQCFLGKFLFPWNVWESEAVIRSSFEI